MTNTNTYYNGARTSRVVATRFPEYDRESYTRGWRAGINGGGFALDNADARNEPNEWYDGYLDAATGREKWHKPFCGERHHNGEGGCKQA